MNQEDMTPSMNIGDYVPPVMQPEHLVDPLMRNLQSQVEHQEESTQQMMSALQEQGNQALAAQRQRTAEFRMNVSGLD